MSANLTAINLSAGQITVLSPRSRRWESDTVKRTKSVPIERLAELMRCARGKMLVSINDTPEIREAFAGCTIREVETTYTIATATAGGKRVGELVIGNFDFAVARHSRPG